MLMILFSGYLGSINTNSAIIFYVKEYSIFSKVSPLVGLCTWPRTVLEMVLRDGSDLKDEKGHEELDNDP